MRQAQRHPQVPQLVRGVPLLRLRGQAVMQRDFIDHYVQEAIEFTQSVRYHLQTMRVRDLCHAFRVGVDLLRPCRKEAGAALKRGMRAREFIDHPASPHGMRENSIPPDQVRSASIGVAPRPVWIVRM
ncbi:MAG: hypothetical protein QM688_11665 [Sphingomonas bacterium]